MSGQNDFVKTALRVPPELHAKVHADARAAGRTFNAELIHKLSGAADDKVSLRDQFAGQALAALIAKDDKEGKHRGALAVPILARFAYEYADAMIAARGAA